MGRKRKQQPLESSVQEVTTGTRKSTRKRKLPATEEGEQSDHDSDNQGNLSDKTEESVEELVKQILDMCC